MTVAFGVVAATNNPNPSLYVFGGTDLNSLNDWVLFTNSSSRQTVVLSNQPLGQAFYTLRTPHDDLSITVSNSNPGLLTGFTVNYANPGASGILRFGTVTN